DDRQELLGGLFITALHRLQDLGDVRAHQGMILFRSLRTVLRGARALNLMPWKRMRRVRCDLTASGHTVGTT
ncbi:MAG: hypothetical protein O6949_01040, partial [Chloroflexi bacterium]|nr:hypothetical protein [Chloroflexota bacterium]